MLKCVELSNHFNIRYFEFYILIFEFLTIIMARRKFSKKERPEYDQKLLELARVTRVVKGGRRFRFRAVLIIGNRNGRVGVGVAKGADVSEAIRKAFNSARKKLVQIKRHNNTISCQIEAKVGGAKVMIKPAKLGGNCGGRARAFSCGIGRHSGYCL